MINKDPPSNFRLLTAGIRFKKKKDDGTSVSTTFLSEDVDVSSSKSDEIWKSFRKRNRIKTSGSDVSDPVATWSALKEAYALPDDLTEAVSDVYAAPTPVQSQVIPLMLDGREVLCCAPTGSGKTAAYLIPLVRLLRGPVGRVRAVIVCPTRELSGQIQRECTKFATCRELKSKVPSGGTAEFGKTDILVSTPNALVYAIEKGNLDLSKVEILVIDESDKLFESGERGFREQLAVIYKACSNSKRAMFSATLAPEVERWCRLNLDNPVEVTVGARNEACNDVEQELLYAGNEKGKVLALKDLIRKGMKPPVLLFVQEIERADELRDILVKEGLKAEVIHSKRSQLQRESAVKSFRAGRTWCLICTELMSRGIDIKGVNLVINYDFPPSVFSYIHRVGRTGRAGRKGKAVTLFTNQDKTLLRNVARIVRASGSQVPDYMLTLKKASREEKRKLATTSVKRDSIVPGSKREKAKLTKKKEMIEASKRRKIKAEEKAKNGGTGDEKQLPKKTKIKSVKKNKKKDINLSTDKVDVGKKRKREEKTKKKSKKRKKQLE